VRGLTARSTKRSRQPNPAPRVRGAPCPPDRGDRPPGLSVQLRRRSGSPHSPWQLPSLRQLVEPLIHPTLTNRLTSLFHNRADLRVRSAEQSSEDHRSHGPSNSIAGARTSVSARWAFVERPAPRWAQNKSGSAHTRNRFMSHAIPHQQRPSERCPEGTFFHSPGVVRSTTLGCEDNPIGSSLKGMASGMPPG
jgi:hypothetical protein